MRRAFEERTRAPRRRDRASNTSVARGVGAALAAAVVAAVFSPPGRAVFERVREAVGVEHAEPALFSLPAPGRLLVVSAEGGGVWLADANGYKRKLGSYDDAAVVAARALRRRDARERAASRSTSTRASAGRSRAASPSGRAGKGRGPTRGSPTSRASGLRVVAGDGTGDHLLDRNARRGRRRPGHRGAGFAITVRLRRRRDRPAERRRGVSCGAARSTSSPTALQWSTDGTVARGRSPRRGCVVLDGAGHVRRTISMLGSAADCRPRSSRARTSSPSSHPLAGPQRGAARRRRPSRT